MEDTIQVDLTQTQISTILELLHYAIDTGLANNFNDTYRYTIYELKDMFELL